MKKTKRHAKQAMVELLQTCSSDQITVTKLCAAADMSRVTFYCRYRDKYDLIEEMFHELLGVAQEDFQRLQKKNNPTDS